MSGEWGFGHMTRSGNFYYTNDDDDGIEEEEDSEDGDYHHHHHTKKKEKETKRPKKSVKPKPSSPPVMIIDQSNEVLTLTISLEEMREKCDRLEKENERLQGIINTPPPTPKKENTYDWRDIVDNDALCQQFYHISFTKMSIVEATLLGHIRSVGNISNKGVSLRKQLLMLMDYLLNGVSMETIADRAQLHPTLVATILRNIFDTCSSLLYVSLISNKDLLQKPTTVIPTQYDICNRDRRLGIVHCFVCPVTEKVVFYNYPKPPYLTGIQLGNIVRHIDDDFNTRLLEKMSTLFKVINSGRFTTFEQGTNVYSIVFSLWNVL